MRRFIAFLFLVFLAFVNLAKSGAWWEEKPYTEWSIDQTVEFLNDSPWIGLSNGYFRQKPFAIVKYQARLISAKPVREAFFRLNVLSSKVVSIKEINPATAADEAKKRMQRLAESYPNDLLVKGDEKHLIIAISLKILRLGLFGYSSSQEDFYSDELQDVENSKRSAATILRTDTGKQVALEYYRPPGRRRPGAMYYFPRNLPDGKPLVSSGDKELRFETVINKRHVKLKFDLSKMRYKGNLEI